MKNIIATMALAMGSACLMPAVAENIISTDALSNGAVYNITRTSTAARGGGLLRSVEGSSQLSAGGSDVSASGPEAQWSIHYSPVEKAFYVYHLSAGKFLGGNNRHQAVLSDTPADVAFNYHPASKSWLLDCGGYAIGLAADNEGAALFFDDLRTGDTRTLGSFFTVAPVEGASVSDAVSAEIEAKITAGRESAMTKYTDFLTRANNMANTTNANYKKCLGAYDTERLQYAVDHADEFTLNEIEDIYQETLLSRYPKAGHFYRLHFNGRPSSTWIKNATRTTESGQLTGENFSGWGYGTATEGFSDNLGLFRFWPVNGDPRQVKIQVSAFGEYLTQASNGGVPGRTTDASNATVFTLDTKSITARTFTLAQPDGETWLTMGNSNAPHTVQAWNVKEDFMNFYIEMVEEIEIPVDANGYASICLPCGVSLPEGCKAYTVTSVTGGKAYVEEIAGPIHQKTPWILKAPAGAASVTLPVENNLHYISTEMSGTPRVVEAPGRYVPVYGADGISFTYAEASKVQPGSIYIVSDNQGDLATVMGANPDAAIEEITVGEAAARPLFDLQGRRVTDTPLPGLYINAATRRVVRVR